MTMPDVPADDFAHFARLMRLVASQTRDAASQVTLLFVTNLYQGELADLGPDGILNTAQHYTRRQADEMIRSFQELGVTVEAFFDERSFLRAVVDREPPRSGRHEIVFTTAEGGSGSGRRALIPAACNLLELPVLNSGAHACSLARHKFHANAVLKQVGVRVPDAWHFKDGDWVGSHAPPRGARVIIKPTYESMCIGIDDDSVLIVDADFADFVRERHRRFGQSLLVQEFVSGAEVGVPLIRLGATYALPPIAFLRANGEPYGTRPKTFDDENLQHDVSHALYEPPHAQLRALREAAVLAFDTLEMSGVGRIDFRVDADGRAWLFDTSESPPPVDGTAYAMAMKSIGLSLADMPAVWLGACLLEAGLISGVAPEGQFAARD
ncbi:MAG: hypothetical protein JWQ18_2578 [Conexibacter sp.]|nr:hypothetical protein [Conexibacter sp.]